MSWFHQSLKSDVDFLNFPKLTFCFRKWYKLIILKSTEASRKTPNLTFGSFTQAREHFTFYVHSSYSPENRSLYKIGNSIKTCRGKKRVPVHLWTFSYFTVNGYLWFFECSQIAFFELSVQFQNILVYVVLQIVFFLITCSFFCQMVSFQASETALSITNQPKGRFPVTTQNIQWSFDLFCYGGTSKAKRGPSKKAGNMEW